MVLKERAMQVDEELAQFSTARDIFLAVGVFDGVHLGHRYLISQLKEVARREGALSGVVTFKQHPREVLYPATSLPHLSTVAERVELLRNEGVDTVVVLSFTHEMAELTARQFISRLMKHLRMRGLVVGSDFALGKGREGDISNLRKLGEELDFNVTVVSMVMSNDEPISSTAIRNALAAGDMKRTNELLGRPFGLGGRVAAGSGRGRKMGFPTANIDVEADMALPSDGVYVTWANVNGYAYQSMTNIGTCPTFNGQERTVEVYLLDYEGDLYDHDMRINVIERLRDERRFDSVEELKKQIAEDIERGKVILNAGSGD
jgi:riboflavin kinase/FMN adenylyltransferase